MIGLRYRFQSVRGLGLGVAALALLVGCAELPMHAPTPSFDVIEKAKASRTAPVALGQFKVDPGVNPEIDKGLSVRTNHLFSPYDHSFAQFLRQTALTDLQASGLYDANAPLTLSGYLTDSTLNVPTDRGEASLGARFILTRGEQKVFEKKLKTEASWESTFLGITAIQDGINQYTNLYHKILGILLSDPDYQKANSK